MLVANRGEIAVRIIRACRELGIETVLAASGIDRDSLAAELADRAVTIGPSPARASYLNVPLVVQAALSTGCDALHPGYGFLSERAELATTCEENGITFVGPRSDTIRALGDKLSARELARHAGVPMVPGTARLENVREARTAASEIGFPVVMKASAGGGGRGMFVASDAAAIDVSFDRASNEAREAFGDGSLYLERYVERARHVEVQILGDGAGKVVHVGERDCSAQRRYQKVIEEAPCVVMSDAARAGLHAAAVQLTSSVAYRNAGTVEVIFDLDREAFYFMEVNARIQVEHPVSEAVSGLDLVGWQLRIAAGEPLELEQSAVVLRGHAIECRINAEDASADFRPSPGRISRWVPPAGEGIRLDSYCRTGTFVPPYYDSMIGKLIAFGVDRPAALERMRRALDEFEIEGIRTNVPFQRYVVAHPDFVRNDITTGWLERTVLPSFTQS